MRALSGFWYSAARLPWKWPRLGLMLLLLYAAISKNLVVCLKKPMDYVDTF